MLDHDYRGTALRLVDLVGSPGRTDAPPGVGMPGISLGVATGSLAVLLGQEGAGKTACLRIAAGLDKAESGRVEIDGEDVTARTPATRGITAVFQSFILLSVSQNIGFGLLALGVPTAERMLRVSEAAGGLELGGLLDLYPDQLSAAERQRVALARAFVMRPRICLLDEPMSEQDADRRPALRRGIQRLQRRIGMTMVYASSNPAEAAELADQIVLLNAGRVEQDGSPAELHARPATRFAAGLIGTPPMNLLPAGSIGPVPSGAKTVGIRPEAIRLQRAGSPARIEHAELQGGKTFLSMRLLHSGERLVACVPGAAAQGIGALVSIGCDPGQMHFFDGFGVRLG